MSKQAVIHFVVIFTIQYENQNENRTLKFMSQDFETMAEAADFTKVLAVHIGVAAINQNVKIIEAMLTQTSTPSPKVATDTISIQHIDYRELSKIFTFILTAFYDTKE